MDVSANKTHAENVDKTFQMYDYSDLPVQIKTKTLRQAESGIQPIQVDQEEERHGNCWVRTVERLEVWTGLFWTSHKLAFLRVVKILIVMFYLAYVSYSWYYRFGDEGSIILLVITSLLALWALGKVLKVYGVTERLYKSMKRPLKKLSVYLIYIGYCLYPLTTLAVCLYLGLEVLPRNPRNIQSLIGIGTFIAICFVLSTKPSRINWHPVFWGIMIQIGVAIFTLRTQVGYFVFHRLGDAIQTFTDFSNSGAAFVFGKDFGSWGLLFQAGGMLVFFNSIISVLFHLGVIDVIVRYGGRTVAFCMGTGPVESVVAVTNIFLGQPEVILLTQPYLKGLTLSEFCAVMTCGYASVSGGLIGIFIAYGAPPNHLLTAAVISAPAALAFSKIIMPETSKRTEQSFKSMHEKSESRSILSACSEGAIAAIGMVAAITANMLAFYSIMMMFDSVLQWMGDRVGINDLGFETVCGYLLYPLAFVMGVHPEDCFSVGALVGVKMFATPMTGFYELGRLIQNRVDFEHYRASITNGSWHKVGRDIILDATNTTLIKGAMQERSEIISTYAICGFSAFTALAIGIAGYFAVCPERKKDVMKVIPYGFFAGNIACFATGSVAGLMYNNN